MAQKPDGLRDLFRDFALLVGALIVVVTLFGLPILAFGTEGAPQFFGSFIAAGLALFGVIFVTFYSSRREQSRDSEQRRHAVLAIARASRAQISIMLRRVKSNIEILQQHIAEANETGASNQATHLFSDTFGKLPPTHILEQNLVQLCGISQDVAGWVSEFLENKDRYAYLHSRMTSHLADGRPLDVEGATFAIDHLGRLLTSGLIAKDALEDFLGEQYTSVNDIPIAGPT